MLHSLLPIVGMALLVVLNACSEPVSIDGISSDDLSQSSSSEEGDWWNEMLDSSDEKNSDAKSSSQMYSSIQESSSQSPSSPDYSSKKSSNQSSATIEPSSSSVQVSSSSKPTDAEKRAALNEEIGYIFDDIGDVKTYEIVIDPAALARMDAAPKAEEYEWADLKFEGEIIERVQVRYKGSYGAWYNCAEGDMGSTIGKKTCIKLSTKIKFSTADDPERKFFGLKKLNFYHMHFYDNQMKDRLSYWMHREMGQPAPRVVHAKLKINGTLIGLYSLIEQIDGRFTRAHWDDGEGNIYKEHMPVKNGSFSTEETLFEKLETNEDENPTYDTWQGFEQELLDAKGTESIKSVIRKYWDIENLVSVILTSNAMDHWDSPFTRDDGHNSYWYSDTTTGKLYPIPWDMDNASYVSGVAPVWAGNIKIEEETRYALQCNSQHKTNKFSKYWLCFPDETQAVLDKLLDEVYPQIPDLLDRWAEQIADAHNEVSSEYPNSDGYPKTGALSYDRWISAIETFKDDIERGRQVVEGWR